MESLAEVNMKQGWLKEQMRQRTQEFSDSQNFSFFCGTWNVNDKILPDNDNSRASLLQAWLIPDGECSDVYAIGFQEAVDLTAVNVVMSNQKCIDRVSYWKEKIDDCLSPSYSGAYTLLMEQHLVGLIMFIYVRSTLRSSIHDIRGVETRNGVMGRMGNKGSVAIRIIFELTSICFVCSHFHANRENILARNADFRCIIEKTILVANDIGESQDDSSNLLRNKWWSDGDRVQYTSVGILDHDIVFWLGDLNYRIDESVDTTSIFDAISSDQWQALVDMDQLNIERKKGTVFQTFNEGLLTFPPTYKYQPGTDIYDRRPDKKIRAPAWCDRVLWRTSANISTASVKQLRYERAPLLPSDHKPVLATFSCAVQCINYDKERQVYQDLLVVLDRWENSTAPRVEVPERMIDLGLIQLNKSYQAHVVIKNTGGVFVQWGFVPKMQDTVISQEWLRVSPLQGLVAPGEETSVLLEVQVTAAMLAVLKGASDREVQGLEDIVIIRIAKGSDYFCIINAQLDSTAPAPSSSSNTAATASLVDVVTEHLK